MVCHRRAPSLKDYFLVPGPFAALANSVGVNGGTAATGDRANRCALFPASYATDQRSGPSASRGGELIAMLLPETSAVLVSISHAGVMVEHR